MPTPLRLIATLLILQVLPTASQAQERGVNSRPTSNNTRRITLNVVVTPKSGKPVTGLQQQDFTILDNNAPQTITNFQANGTSTVPVEIILLIDAVNTNFKNMAFERDQIEKFLRANGGRLPHPVTLAIFTDTGTQIENQSSTDGNQLSAAIEQSPTGLREIHRSSQFGAEDRLSLSIKTLHSLVGRESQRPGRKIIFWVSPGWPLLSGPVLNLTAKQTQAIYNDVVSLSDQLRQNDITIYDIDPLGPGESLSREFYYESFLAGLKNSRDAQPGNLALQVLAIQSGGLVSIAGNDVAGQLQQAMDDTTAYYRISYDSPPAEHSREYHTIEVRVGQPGLKAHTLTGYYAQP